MSDAAANSNLSAGGFWRVLGQRAIGATVVTAQDAEGPRGFLALSASHVAADPPTVLVSAGRKTSALQTIRSSGAFAINILPDNARDLADAFGGRTGVDGAQRFAGHAWTKLATGAPVLETALGVFDCRVDRLIELETSVVVIGRVVDVAVSEGDPLIFFRGKTYGGPDVLGGPTPSQESR